LRDFSEHQTADGKEHFTVRLPAAGQLSERGKASGNNSQTIDSASVTVSVQHWKMTDWKMTEWNLADWEKKD